ncbi:MAG: hypothetical protein CVU64_21715 [Deltaproteobacteria bacterium HGW-Deltaproteobacteria-21]|nr:MAG: hypothetical protein CVU64_21715 [Deltaproteobacteria bacterium HGW-Deltaproteobacteria-21]
MKKGTILFVTEGRDELHDHSDDLRKAREQLGVQAVSVATSEEEVAYEWWRMLAKGMHHVSLLKAAYRGRGNPMDFHGTALRLYG